MASSPEIILDISYRYRSVYQWPGTCHRSFCRGPHNHQTTSSHLARAVYSDVAPLEPRMSVLGSRGTFGIRALTRSTPVTVPPAAAACGCVRSFSVLNRPPPNYPGHIPLTTVERGALAVGSAIGSYLNPRRAGALSLEVYKHTLY